MNFKKMTAVGLALGLVAGTATNASAWWHRSKDMTVVDTSAMRKTDAVTVNVHIFDLVSQTTSVRLCRQSWFSTSTVCSTAVSIAGQGNKEFFMGSRVSTWTTSDFGYITMSSPTPQQRVPLGLYMTN